jgi:two-component system response regulator YesN
MEGNYARPLKLRDIAAVLHVSPEHACEVFRRELGVSPMKKLRQVRIEKAEVFLENTEMTIKQVAFAVGYEDEHYFSRLFRKVTGRSPTAYREGCRS